MASIVPFRGLRPPRELARAVAAPPYDVLSSAEARVMAEGNPSSFLHVNKPEIDVDPSVGPYDDAVYAKGIENFRRMREQGVLVRDPEPCFYLYRQTMRIGDREHAQVGLVAGASVAEYEGDLIRKHELTRADKEADRTRHVEELNANAGPVFLTYRAEAAIDDLVAREAAREPDMDFVADDGVGHTLWVVADPAAIERLSDLFAAVPRTYVADGHHRSASAAAYGRKRREANPGHTGDEPYNYFMAVLFPHDQLYIMDYNRVVLDSNDLTVEEFLGRVRERFDVETASEPRPERATRFGMYLDGKWYRLTARPGTFDAADPVARLDVAILQRNLLAPVLGIGDPRTDKRIDFVGGIRGTEELERRVDGQGGGAAFAMFPTSVEQLMAIADAGAIMPPKSTWFEPKLRSGVVVRTYDG